MGNNIYSVKQAAKILGLSTNTTYKYLNEGRIKAARGHIRGTFIITRRSLENFLGSKLPDNPFSETESPNFSSSNIKDAEAVIEVSPPTMTTKVVRVLITLCLILIIADLIFTKNFSPISQLGRVFLIVLIFLVSYQFGGFIKK